MNIGTIIWFDAATFEKKVSDLKKLGFNSFQFQSWDPTHWTDENVELIKKVLKKYDVTISAFWCGWEGPMVWDFYDGQLTLGLVPVEYRQMRIKNLCDGADFAKKIGVTDVATHMGFIPENPYDEKFNSFCVAAREVANHLKANGQYLLFESGQETPVTMLRSFEKIGTDNLAVNLDTANLILYGKGNPVDALDVIGKYVRNIHAKDGLFPTNGHELGRETKLGEGRADFRAFFKKLHELGYDSYVTIEREIEGDKQIEDILYAKKYLENIISEIY